MKSPRFLQIFLLLFVSSASLRAQSTFTQVYNLLQSKCYNAGCHDGSDATFNVSVPEADLYSALVNAAPQNATAVAKGDKLITPGYSDRSFLLRKIAYGISSPLVIDEQHEGSYMPDSANRMTDKEIELVRQWVLWGAKQTGVTVDTALINAFYGGHGIDDTYADHAPPAPSEGFQIYVGKILVPPGEEHYYFFKYNPRLPANTEIPKVVTLMPASAHHFILYRFFPGEANSYGDGLRGMENNSHASTSDGIGSASGLWDFTLPNGSAYVWPKNQMLDLNLHIKNINPSTVIGTDLYINIYTQPMGTATQYMLIRNFIDDQIAILPNNQVTEFWGTAYDSTETRMWNIWTLYSHTHQWGKDFDIYMRNPDGSRGVQVYEGFYNKEYTFNQGFYSTGVDVAMEKFENGFLQVDPRLGFIYHAKYQNATADTVFWGFNSYEEMLAVGFQFMYGDTLGDYPTAVEEKPLDESSLRVFSNPAQRSLLMSYDIQKTSDVTIRMVNILGEATEVFSGIQPAGTYQHELNLNGTLPQGIYILTLQLGEKTFVKKVTLQ